MRASALCHLIVLLGTCSQQCGCVGLACDSKHRKSTVAEAIGDSPMGASDVAGSVQGDALRLDSSLAEEEDGSLPLLLDITTEQLSLAGIEKEIEAFADSEVLRAILDQGAAAAGGENGGAAVDAFGQGLQQSMATYNPSIWNLSLPAVVCYKLHRASLLRLPHGCAGVDPREYSRQYEAKLRQAEVASVQDYIAESDSLTALHSQVGVGHCIWQSGEACGEACLLRRSRQLQLSAAACMAVSCRQHGQAGAGRPALWHVPGCFDVCLADMLRAAITRVQCCCCRSRCCSC